MAPTNFEKAQKIESESLKALHLLKNQATLILADATRLNHSEQIPWDYYTRLQEGVSQYEASLRALIAVSNKEQ